MSEYLLCDDCKSFGFERPSACCPSQPIKSQQVILYWLSWYQKTDDHRPMTYPPNEMILGWWCTGVRCDDNAKTLVALVKADSEEAAKTAVEQDWPEATEWRFCDLKRDTKLSDRYPLSEWMKPRIQAVEC